MTEDHWINRRLACNSDAVFDALHVEVERVVYAWNNHKGNDPTVVRVARERDNDGFERIKIYLGDRQRAYFGHIPDKACITGSRTVMGNIGNLKDAGAVAVIVKWDPEQDECVVADANGQETVESLARWALEPLLFSTEEHAV